MAKQSTTVGRRARFCRGTCCGWRRHRTVDHTASDYRRTGNRPERPALAQRHAGILTFAVNADNGAIGSEQIRDDRADALARSRWGNRDKLGRAVIAEQPAKGVPPDQQIALVLCQRVDLGARSEGQR